jgi:hypothetical protein
MLIYWMILSQKNISIVHFYNFDLDPTFNFYIFVKRTEEISKFRQKNIFFHQKIKKFLFRPNQQVEESDFFFINTTLKYLQTDG